MPGAGRVWGARAVVAGCLGDTGEQGEPVVLLGANSYSHAGDFYGLKR